jgi:CubicO group peptidase (beta-lactamase class C family)
MVIRRPAGNSNAPPTPAGARRENTDLRPFRGSPAGGAYSTVEDLLKFINALDSHKILSAASLALLQEGKVSTRPDGPKYGYGFNEWVSNGHRIVGHGGGGPGINSMLQVYPGLDYTVIVLSNYDPPAAEEVAAKARELITQK